MDALARELDGMEGAFEGPARLAPRPRTIADTGLSMSFLADLLGKHMLNGGVMTLSQLAERVLLPARLLEDVLHFMRKESRVEVLAADTDSSSLRFALTDRGRSAALNAFIVSGYAGPAPVPLTHYVRVVHEQTVHGHAVTSRDVRAAFHDVVVSDDLLDDIGPSLNSGRAIFIYGPAGTGKTYISQRMARVFSSTVLIPHAILVNDTVLSVFDPVIHKAISARPRSSLSVEDGFDQRFALCQRPMIVAGGELTADMLEVQYDANDREYRAPLQMKANNGLFIIDDMGRQQVEPQAVFNRWIVPLEEKRDFLSLGSGRHFSVPFDVVLIFSTNLNPNELADEAFLRRIGYKIRFPHLDADQYERIWREQCRERGIPFDRDVLDYVINHLHGPQRIPLLPCHPRDLLGLCVDRAIYTDKPRETSREIVDWAWRNYFADTGDHTDSYPQMGEGQ